jgi:adenylate kinase family enzyme
MNKIVIIGACGAGKTTLAGRMSEKLGIDATDMDDLHWRPGWIEADRALFRADVTKAVSHERWIISGNYQKTAKELIWPYADTLIWIDYGFWRTLYQLLGRTMARIKDRKAICNGNYESLKLTFSKDSIIFWYLKTYRQRQRDARALMNEKRYQNITHYIHLRTPDQTAGFLKGLRSK